MSLLSDKKIEEEYSVTGRIVILPYNELNLGTNSYDVTLGNYYYSQKNYLNTSWAWDPTNEETISDFWAGPFDADVDNNGRILIPAGQTVLAHTQEIIGGRHGITTSIRARSSIARCGLSIAKCAGLGDVGFINRWTLEISNHSTNAIVLPVGLRVGQMMFYDVGETLKEYTGKYGQGDWKPEDMLPKLYNDREFRDDEP